MKAHTAPAHLITARDHGIHVPDLYNVERPTPHIECVVTRECDPDPLEELEPGFTFGTCMDCSDSLRRHEFQAHLDVLGHLHSTVYAAENLARIIRIAIDGTTPRDPADLDADDQLDFLETYARVGQAFRPFSHFGGTSYFVNTIRKQVSKPVGLWGHVIDLADDLTRQWTRLVAMRPAHHLATFEKPAGRPLLRAVLARGPGLTLVDPDVNEDTLWHEAVRLEATLVHQAPGWDLLGWSTSLPTQATDPGSYADPAGLTDLEVESAFHLYTRTAGTPGAPTFQDIVDAIHDAKR